MTQLMRIVPRIGRLDAGPSGSSPPLPYIEIERDEALAAIERGHAKLYVDPAEGPEAVIDPAVPVEIGPVPAAPRIQSDTSAAKPKARQAPTAGRRK